MVAVLPDSICLLCTSAICVNVASSRSADGLTRRIPPVIDETTIGKGFGRTEQFIAVQECLPFGQTGARFLEMDRIDPAFAAIDADITHIGDAAIGQQRREILTQIVVPQL